MRATPIKHLILYRAAYESAVHIYSAYICFAILCRRDLLGMHLAHSKLCTTFTFEIKKKETRLPSFFLLAQFIIFTLDLASTNKFIARVKTINRLH